VKLLVVTPRPPFATGKGDQIRLAQVLPALAARHRVTLVHPVGPGEATVPVEPEANPAVVPVPITRGGGCAPPPQRARGADPLRLAGSPPAPCATKCAAKRPITTLSCS
jgi:hypothetical protein